MVFEKFTKPYRGRDDTDWFKLTDEMIDTIRNEYQLKLVKPICSPGSLVLWDSRTIHSPDDGSDFGIGRSVFYVCYLPYQSDTFTIKEEEKKRNAFNEMRATQHTPFPQHMFPKKCRTYGKENMRYVEIESAHLFATTLKKYENGKDKTDALTKCLLPDKEEELLFGFKSYSSIPKSIGLWGKKYDKDCKPLVGLIPMSTEWIPLSKRVIQYRKDEKERKVMERDNIKQKIKDNNAKKEVRIKQPLKKRKIDVSL